MIYICRKKESWIYETVELWQGPPILHLSVWLSYLYTAGKEGIDLYPFEGRREKEPTPIPIPFSYQTRWFISKPPSSYIKHGLLPPRKKRSNELYPTQRNHSWSFFILGVDTLVLSERFTATVDKKNEQRVKEGNLWKRWQTFKKSTGQRKRKKPSTVARSFTGIDFFCHRQSYWFKKVLMTLGIIRSCLFFHKLLFLLATRNECLNEKGLSTLYKVVDPKWNSVK